MAASLLPEEREAAPWSTPGSPSQLRFQRDRVDSDYELVLTIKSPEIIPTGSCGQDAWLVQEGVSIGNLLGFGLTGMLPIALTMLVPL